MVRVSKKVDTLIKSIMGYQSRNKREDRCPEYAYDFADKVVEHVYSSIVDSSIVLAASACVCPLFPIYKSKQGKDAYYLVGDEQFLIEELTRLKNEWKQHVKSQRSRKNPE